MEMMDLHLMEGLLQQEGQQVEMVLLLMEIPDYRVQLQALEEVGREKGVGMVHLQEAMALMGK